MAEATLEKIRATLEEELGSVERQLRDHGIEPTTDQVSVSVDEGFADSAQATAERGEFLALVDQLRSHRAEVLTALQRMDEGTYGKCENCGRPIPLERLEAIPTTTLCVACKQQR